MVEKGNSDWNDKLNTHLKEEYEKILSLKKQIKPEIEAIKIIIIYLIMGFLWVLLSDYLLSVLVNDTKVFNQIQLYKGWFYVVITGGVFYKIIRKSLLLYKRATDTILLSYQELETAHEEMVSMNEELYEQNHELEIQRNTIMVSKQRYELAVEGANDGIWDWDLITDVYFISLKWRTILGYAKDELDDDIMTWKQLLHPKDRERVERTLQQYLDESKGYYECTYRVRCKTGEYRWILSRAKGIWDSDGNPVRIAGSHTDITQQMLLQESLSAQKELSESIIRDAPMIIIVLDEKENIIQFNPYAEAVLGYSKEEVMGKNATEMLIEINHRGQIHQLFYDMLEEKTLSSMEIKIKCKDGKFRIILWNNNLLHDKDDKIRGTVLIGLDITERREMEDKLQLLAYYDTLTGLPNKVLFEKKAFDMMKRHNRMVLVNLDIDDFKHINDTLGHFIGDNIMQHVSQILSDVVPESGMIARLSGDQFAFLFVLQEQESLKTKLEMFLNYIRTPWHIGEQTYYITVSMGAAVYPDDGVDFQSLMQKSEIAMFHGKERGKDGYTIFEKAMYEEILYHIQMSNQLRKAIENEEFLLYYQPQYDLKTEKIIGVEALIRWIHPEKGFISPIEFITFAEKTGHIIQIDKWVLKTAIKQKKEWEKIGYPPIKMAINLSGYVVTKSDIIDDMCEILKRMDLKPGEIEIEVTETAVIKELDIAKESLGKLKECGIQIALDDFGTGYSSLTYLKTLPFDILKIDREFIKDVKNEEDNMYLYKAVVDLAHDMKLQVVAEGVETKEQKEFLSKNNCDIGQGYYFSKPLPAFEVENLLKSDKIIRSS